MSEHGVIQNAETRSPIEVHIRTIPGRLMWLADHLETEGHKPGVRLGVAAGLRLIAEEMTLLRVLENGSNVRYDDPELCPRCFEVFGLARTHNFDCPRIGDG